MSKKLELILSRPQYVNQIKKAIDKGTRINLALNGTLYKEFIKTMNNDLVISFNLNSDGATITKYKNNSIGTIIEAIIVKVLLLNWTILLVKNLKT